MGQCLTTVVFTEHMPGRARLGRSCGGDLMVAEHCSCELTLAGDTAAGLSDLH